MVQFVTKIQLSLLCGIGEGRKSDIVGNRMKSASGEGKDTVWLHVSVDDRLGVQVAGIKNKNKNLNFSPNDDTSISVRNDVIAKRVNRSLHHQYWRHCDVYTWRHYAPLPWCFLTVTSPVLIMTSLCRLYVLSWNIWRVDAYNDS